MQQQVAEGNGMAAVLFMVFGFDSLLSWHVLCGGAQGSREEKRVEKGEATKVCMGKGAMWCGTAVGAV